MRRRFDLETAIVTVLSLVAVGLFVWVAACLNIKP
jgi:hypothetical protein